MDERKLGKPSEKDERVHEILVEFFNRTPDLQVVPIETVVSGTTYVDSESGMTGWLPERFPVWQN